MDIKTQAELRRRKILANAEARLKKITSRSVDHEETPIDVIDEEHTSPNNSHSNGACNSDVSSVPISGSSFDREDFLLLEEPLITQNERLSEEEEQDSSELRTSLLTQSQIQTFRMECIFFLILGNAIRLMIHVGLSWIFLQNMLGPFIIFCLPRLSSIFHREVQLSGVLSLIVMAGACQRRLRVQTVLKVFCALRTILQFFALYSFSFIITDFIITEKLSR